MKKIKNIIYALALISTIASCEQKLDIPSQASLSANAPLSQQDVDRLLNGLYKKVRHPNGYGYFSIMNTEIMADNYKPVKFQWFQVRFLYEHTVPASDILLSYYYADYYAGIDRANTILKVPTATDDQKGKARVCRAYTYLRLFDLFERVPLIDENYDRKPIAPSSKEEVLNFIINDLKFAKEHCRAFDKNNVTLSQQFPTKEAATAMLARVYRIAGNLQQAAKEAEEVIATGKFSLAENPLERSSEVIFMFIGTKAEEVGSWGWIMSPMAKNWNCFAAADAVTALVKDGDTRKVLFDFEGKDANGGYIYSKKYKTDDNSDLLVSRIAEMYLISAEAGNNARLAEFQKARKSSLTLAEERRLEMSFEWTRWQDLKLEGEKYVLPYPERAVQSNPLLK
ncbi:hypothetical protein HMPREF1981_00969 [Bacteroides pyogenes F0041]|uniref:SusD-like N-terminal domain-containing protein n=2 Tax=Bacteroides pyogenes TaxID=310300 RepID=U2CP11_9BACE|nr:RagB/SusD family nutrient uptake outer membrane protein [Bacteroides pyogenes]ERI86265.1 hypothetical protein HMPREF1981_00969 [Bacteroides pyogenes F0041]MBB3894206.1 hypothetical protein [Bacteroides pyogenes]SUV35925.1 SusD family [Bacteroides pyogenes]